MEPLQDDPHSRSTDFYRSKTSKKKRTLLVINLKKMEKKIQLFSVSSRKTLICDRLIGAAINVKVRQSFKKFGFQNHKIRFPKADW